MNFLVIALLGLYVILQIVIYVKITNMCKDLQKQRQKTPLLQTFNNTDTWARLLESSHAHVRVSTPQGGALQINFTDVPKTSPNTDTLASKLLPQTRDIDLAQQPNTDSLTIEKPEGSTLFAVNTLADGDRVWLMLYFTQPHEGQWATHELKVRIFFS